MFECEVYTITFVFGMLQAMSALVVREGDAHQLPYFLKRRVENIPQRLKDAWDAKDYDTAFLYAVGYDKEIAALCIMRGANEQRILGNFREAQNIPEEETPWKLRVVVRRVS